MNRGDLVTLWDGDSPWRLASCTPEGLWRCERPDNPRLWVLSPRCFIRPYASRGARDTDPATSHLAAQQAAAVAAGNRRKVLEVLAASDGPMSDFDLATALDMLPTSVGKRRGELRDEGLVEQADRAGVSHVGSPCIRWQLTEAGRRVP